ncbi:hypothetical protein AAL_07778 [Moelleriella libera RCEF 2490]|uniref:Distal membrane-arm assembly complex protein 1-like domain-containing protein n=1 Tax=Moelleriella libera RCEF 2490 TaxID=1081109 RepID=A0A166NCL4_9HYPO|nr:hypothetical protein AAL_07778 [Moelleriella libera RCEF 2490]
MGGTWQSFERSEGSPPQATPGRAAGGKPQARHQGSYCSRLGLRTVPHTATRCCALPPPANPRQRARRRAQSASRQLRRASSRTPPTSALARSPARSLAAMAGDALPTVHALEKPQDLKGLLRQDRGDDCLSCRVVGSGAFFGLAAYSYFSGMAQLERQRHLVLRRSSKSSPWSWMTGMRSRKLGVAGISLGLAWMGLWRAFG